MVNPGAFFGKRKEFLKVEKAAYATAMECGYAADAIANIQRRFFKRFPIDLPLDQEPTDEFLAAVNDDEADQEPEQPKESEMTPEEYTAAMTRLEERKNTIAYRKGQIKRWLNYQYMKDNSVNDPSREGAYRALLAKLTGSTDSRPRQKTASNVWRRDLRDVIEVEARRRVAALDNKKKLAAIRQTVATEMFAALTDEERGKWEKVAKQEHNIAVAKWEAEVHGAPSSLPIDRQKCILGLVAFVQPILDGISAATGWKCSLIAGGPEPAFGGRLTIVSAHSGTTSGDIKMNFVRAERQKYKEGVLPAFGSFLRKCYTPEDCRAYALSPNANIEGMDPEEMEQQGAGVDTLPDSEGTARSNTSTSSIPSILSTQGNSGQDSRSQSHTVTSTTNPSPSTATQAPDSTTPTPTPVTAAQLPPKETSGSSVSSGGPASPTSTPATLGIPAAAAPASAPNLCLTNTSVAGAPPALSPPTSHPAPPTSSLPTSPPTRDVLMTDGAGPDFTPDASATPDTLPRQMDWESTTGPGTDNTVAAETAALNPPLAILVASDSTPKYLSSAHPADVPLPLKDPTTTGNFPPDSSGSASRPPTPPLSPTRFSPPLLPVDGTAQASQTEQISRDEAALNEPPSLIPGVTPISPPTFDQIKAFSAMFNNATTKTTSLASSTLTSSSSSGSSSTSRTSLSCRSSPAPSTASSSSTDSLGEDENRPARRTRSQTAKATSAPVPSKRTGASKRQRAISAPQADPLDAPAVKRRRQNRNAADPSHPPAWFEQACLQFGSEDLGEQWTAFVEVWKRFEEHHRYKDGLKLSRTGRPPAIAEWIKLGRSDTWRPEIHVRDFESDFKTWWMSLQPDWRVSRGKIKKAELDGDWAPLRRSGEDGLLNVVAALFFWGINADQSGRCRKSWLQALEDCAAVFERL